ncbi:MAG: PEGA domain-containing protein [Chitinispirillaceae bacterium]|nr:PEGA domain-containing protein [Chitinispirillaceae bacterium]
MFRRTIKAFAMSVCIVSFLCAAAGAQTVAVPAAQQKPSPASSAVEKNNGKNLPTTAPAADTVPPSADTLARKLSAFRVVTEPESAQVYLNDSLRGITPCTVADVVPGIYILALKKVGCYLKKAEITIDSTAEQEFSFSLLRPAFLRVESDPSGAEVSIDGKKTGISPWENDKVKPGDYTVGVALASYKPAEKKIPVASAGVDTLHFQLERTEAYRDSVVAAQRAAAKAARERFHGMLATALFLLGAVVIVLLEMMND